VEDNSNAYFLVGNRPKLFSCPMNQNDTPALDELTEEYPRELFPQSEIDRIIELLN
jgi:hypothetical protein